MWETSPAKVKTKMPAVNMIVELENDGVPVMLEHVAASSADMVWLMANRVRTLVDMGAEYLRCQCRVQQPRGYWMPDPAMGRQLDAAIRSVVVESAA
jgi:hypothetical protein